MKKTTWIIAIVIIFVVLALGLYLHWSYAHFFNYVRQKNLASPAMQKNYEINIQPGQKQIIYVALGDSLSAGTGADNFQDSFPYLLAEKLGEKAEVKLTNLGVPGATAADVWRYQLSGAISSKPDLITLMIGTNDVYNHTGLAGYKNNLEKIMADLKAGTQARLIVINLPKLGAADLLFPPYNYYFDAQTKKFNQAIGEAAAGKADCLIDLYNLTLDAAANNPGYFSADKFHPSAFGYRLWADIIYADPSCFPR